MRTNDYTLIGKFLHEYGDGIYFKLIKNNLLNIDTDEGIDLFFYKIEEFVDDITNNFDVDAYLNMNPRMIDYYRKKKEKFISKLPNKSIDEKLFFLFTKS